MKKRVIAVLLTGLTAISMILGGCGGGNGSSGKEGGEKKAEGKTSIKFYGKVIEYTSGPKMMDVLQEQLKDKYSIDAIQVDWSNLEKVIRTGLASGDPCDVYNFGTYDVAGFADAAVDLTPYLDADPEWKDAIGEEALKPVTIDGKIIAIPWESNFSVILGNKALLEQAGVEVPEKWNYDEFKVACKKIQDSGAAPFGNSADLSHSEWLFRAAMLTQVIDNGTYDDYLSKTLSFNGTEGKTALEALKSLYDEGYMYPGEGAVTVKSDELKAAFAQGKLAMMTDIGAGAKVTAEEMKESGIETVVIPWPSAGKTAAMNGGGNCLFIPKACKNIDAAVEVVKTFTNPEIQGIHAKEGYIPINKNVKIEDPFTKELVKQSQICVPDVVWPAEMNDYRINSLIPDLILNGGVDTVISNLEQQRESALANE
ncbi:Maltose-binding periplasmic proteins/domains [[Eubacterium] contortum]|uniref:Maltose-binding periplasmic proteins/domains n=1 Tax=Faecalicatena contorta TaxID=39482 RepID=A0A174GBP7_9FIRM|nr:extracellular solute-binding protein [Faecalicatena contorta]CUO58320.1 Maltose-binding periplasmic proteins/domains [[Eubacterium] contortum] [Faecalicatena contorta]